MSHAVKKYKHPLFRNSLVTHLNFWFKITVGWIAVRWLTATSVWWLLFDRHQLSLITCLLHITVRTTLQISSVRIILNTELQYFTTTFSLHIIVEFYDNSDTAIAFCYYACFKQLINPNSTDIQSPEKTDQWSLTGAEFTLASQLCCRKNSFCIAHHLPTSTTNWCYLYIKYPHWCNNYSIYQTVPEVWVLCGWKYWQILKLEVNYKITVQCPGTVWQSLIRYIHH